MRGSELRQTLISKLFYPVVQDNFLASVYELGMLSLRSTMLVNSHDTDEV